MTMSSSGDSKDSIRTGSTNSDCHSNNIDRDRFSTISAWKVNCQIIVQTFLRENPVVSNIVSY